MSATINHFKRRRLDFDDCTPGQDQRNQDQRNVPRTAIGASNRVESLDQILNTHASVKRVLAYDIEDSAAILNDFESSLPLKEKAKRFFNSLHSLGKARYRRLFELLTSDNLRLKKLVVLYQAVSERKKECKQPALFEFISGSNRNREKLSPIQRALGVDVYDQSGLLNPTSLSEIAIFIIDSLIELQHDASTPMEIKQSINYSINRYLSAVINKRNSALNVLFKLEILNRPHILHYLIHFPETHEKVLGGEMDGWFYRLFYTSINGREKFNELLQLCEPHPGQVPQSLILFFQKIVENIVARPILTTIRNDAELPDNFAILLKVIPEESALELLDHLFRLDQSIDIDSLISKSEQECLADRFNAFLYSPGQELKNDYFLPEFVTQRQIYHVLNLLKRNIHQSTYLEPKSNDSYLVNYYYEKQMNIIQQAECFLFDLFVGDLSTGGRKLFYKSILKLNQGDFCRSLISLTRFLTKPRFRIAVDEGALRRSLINGPIFFTHLRTSLENRWSEESLSPICQLLNRYETKYGEDAFQEVLNSLYRRGLTRGGHADVQFWADPCFLPFIYDSVEQFEESSFGRLIQKTTVAPEINAIAEKLYALMNIAWDDNNASLPEAINVSFGIYGDAVVNRLRQFYGLEQTEAMEIV